MSGAPCWTSAHTASLTNGEITIGYLFFLFIYKGRAAQLEHSSKPNDALVLVKSLLPSTFSVNISLSAISNTQCAKITAEC